MISKLIESLDKCLDNLSQANIEYTISKNEEGNLDTIILNDLVRTNSSLKRCDNINITYNLLAQKTLIEVINHSDNLEQIYQSLIDCLNKYELISEDKILVDVINNNCTRLTAIELFLRGTLEELDNNLKIFLSGCNQDDKDYLQVLCSRYVNYSNDVQDKIKVVELSLG